ncbi:hypothetical protein PB01_08090 [Psychrobacillus glaciei]|uniref:Uncharacterized protein n=1 Tax=Psychrobacillus glaciei TaxID=2283160 RepID=A0A5J6SLK0_9BACI|nr:hypothetical protein [Psychrobacillus glaciei]QFF98795.1 hypothetical protein PB01_08090 [Psychrobacillus glaciei]
MSHRIIVPYLEIGEFKVATPIGFSELLEPAWTKKIENDEIDVFASSYHRTVFRNPEGRLVTRYEKK